MFHKKHKVKAFKTMTWNISYYGKGSDIGGVLDSAEKQKENRPQEEIHQIEAAKNLLSTICRDNPEAMVSANISGYAYHGENSQAGSFSAAINYSRTP